MLTKFTRCHIPRRIGKKKLIPSDYNCLLALTNRSVLSWKVVCFTYTKAKEGNDSRSVYF